MLEVLRPLWKTRRALFAYAVLIIVGWSFGATLRDFALPELRPMNEPMIHRMVMTALIAYIVLAAIPFVPGAEIGFALLLTFGAKAAPVVYFGMVGALFLAYLVGRFVPARALAAAFRWLGLTRTAALMHEIEGKALKDRSEIFARLGRRGPMHWFARNRYVALAIAINTPGNSLIGGGGGLAFAAGFSGLYTLPAFLVVIVFAVAPVPLLFLLSG